MIVHQYQIGTHTCGQTCVAMVANVPVHDVIKKLGHRHSTKTRELAKLLRDYGFEVPDKLVTYRGTMPELAIVKVPHRRPNGRQRHGWHWVVYHQGKYYDPMTLSFIEYKISSYLPVKVRQGSTGPVVTSAAS